MFKHKRGPDWSRRIGALITVVATILLVVAMALPSWAATLSIDLPLEVVIADPGEREVLHVESVADALVGQTCSVTATGNDNESVHPGNNIEIVSGNTVTLFGVEDVVNKTTTADGVLTLTDTITVTLIMGQDEVYSAALSLHLTCGATTTSTTTSTTVAGCSTSTTVAGCSTSTTVAGCSTSTTVAGCSTSTSVAGSSTSTTQGGTTTTEATTTTTTIVGAVTVTSPSTTIEGSTSTTEDVVGGITVTTTDPDVDDSVLAGTLPFTGADDGLLVGLGASALVLGALLVFAVRREEN